MNASISDLDSLGKEAKNFILHLENKPSLTNKLDFAKWNA